MLEANEKSARDIPSGNPLVQNPESAENARQRRRVVTSSLVGTAIEYYDFMIYSVAATLVIGPLFFAPTSSAMSTILSFGTLLVGYVARPVGSLVFGHYGDRVSRKSALLISLILMGGASVLMGLLPTYAQIGALAPVLLVALRLVQGFAVGGEYGGAALMSVEHAKPTRRGLFGSVPVIGSSAGMLIAYGVFNLVSALTTEEQMLSWAWRIPFVGSFVLVAFALYIRLKIAESPVLAAAKAENEGQANQIPVVDLFRNNTRSILIGIVMVTAFLMGSSLINVYALSYATQNLGISASLMLSVSMIALAGTTFSQPLYGALSDRVGRKPVYIIPMLALAPTMFLFFPILNTGSFGLIVAAFVVVLVILVAGPGGVAGSMLSELFPTKVRYTGISLAFQGGSVFGMGLTPLLAATLVSIGNGSTILLSAGFALICVIGALAALSIKEGRDTDLHTVE